MKKIIFFLAISALGLSACNSNSDKNTAETKDTSQHAMKDMKMQDSANVVAVKPASKTVNISSILNNYLQMKNAFAKDNDKDAASAGTEMVKAFEAFKKAILTPEQAKIYNDVEDDAKEHAEHIGKNAGNIKHQREHFDMLSKDIYQLVKTFGGGQKLYYDHCPMYNDGKGANWISETKDIANPYLGKAMPTCGTVKEELK